jgi:peptide/nickel transport system substrate-binding protein
MTTARFRGLLTALLVATAFAGSALISTPASAQQKTLKFVPEADLRSLDPIWTTAYITRNHGYMVYDTLFSVNDKFEPKPQMLEKYEMSSDGLTYTFTLRDGLKFHDGQAVRSADAISYAMRSTATPRSIDAGQSQMATTLMVVSASSPASLSAAATST